MVTVYEYECIANKKDFNRYEEIYNLLVVLEF